MRNGGPRPRARAVVEATVPVGGAVVMGTGITSIALEYLGHHAVSLAALWLGLAVWIALAALAVWRAATDPARFGADIRTPAVLTTIAGVAVLGERATLQGWDAAGVVALVVGAALWLALMPPVVRALQRRLTGSGLLPVVATQALAVLAGTLAAARGSAALLVLALALGLLGLLAYPLLLARIHPGEIRDGGGDQWIAGGALALCALCAQVLAEAVERTGTATALHGPLETGAVVLLVLAGLWFPVLLLGEMLWPRLRFTPLRWTTVFPVGMYSTACFTIGAAHDSGALQDAGRAAGWVTLTLWAAMAAGTLAAMWETGEHRPSVPPTG